jgi:hypothetical protein
VELATELEACLKELSAAGLWRSGKTVAASRRSPELPGKSVAQPKSLFCICGPSIAT